MSSVITLPFERDRTTVKELFEALLARLFPPDPLGALDVTSRQYHDRLERANLPYRQFNTYVGRIVPGSLKEGPAPPPPPKPGTRESRRYIAEQA